MGLSFWSAGCTRSGVKKCLAVQNADFFQLRCYVFVFLVPWGWGEQSTEKLPGDDSAVSLRIVWADQVLQQCSGTEKPPFSGVRAALVTWGTGLMKTISNSLDPGIWIDSLSLGFQLPCFQC